VNDNAAGNAGVYTDAYVYIYASDEFGLIMPKSVVSDIFLSLE